MYFCRVHSLWKYQLKIYFPLEILFSRCSVCSWKETFEYSHCGMCCYIWVGFCLHICYWCFPKDFEIVPVFMIITSKKLSWFFIFKRNCVLNRWILTVRMSINYKDCSLVLSTAWKPSTNLLNIFGTTLRVRNHFIDDHNESI